MGKTLLSLPKNRVIYQPLFEKARGKRAFPKRPPSNMGVGGKMKFTFILGYKEYLEKTLRAHGNCTLYNARNRGTLIF